MLVVVLRMGREARERLLEMIWEPAAARFEDGVLMAVVLKEVVLLDVGC